jgi:ABC-type uncharacterized transport system auxiliary subunit
VTLVARASCGRSRAKAFDGLRTWGTGRRLIRAVLCWVLTLSGCGAVPATHYYELVVSRTPSGESTAAVLTVQDLTADGAYEDNRIAYRTSPYRLDYYYYHRWPSEPGRLVADYLRRACVRSGQFSAVLSDLTPATTLVLTGRVLRFDELDQSVEQWFGDLELELVLSEPESGRLLWSSHFRGQQPLEERNPEGLAKALSAVLGRVVETAIPVIAANASGRGR